MSKRKPNPAKNRSARGGADAMAKAAVAKRETTTTGKVKLALTVYLSREQAERLAARAIREERSLEAVVGDLLESADSE